MSKKGSFLILILVFLFIYFPQIPPSFKNPNEYSRLYLTMAIVEYKTLKIDNLITNIGDIQDKSFYNGHYYSDKAPGLSFLAVPFYQAIKLFLLLTDLTINLKVLLLILRILCVSSFSVFFCIFLYKMLKEFVDATISMCVTFTFIAGTNLFTYSTLFMSHIHTALFCSAVFYLIYKQEKKKNLFFAGLLSGLAISFDYTTAVIILTLIFYLLILSKNFNKLIIFCSGFLLPVGLLFYYNHSCFGSIFSTGYHHKIDPVLSYYHSKGFAGFTYPKLSAITGFLFSASKGLFFYSPFIIPALMGYFHLFKNNYKISAILCLIPILHILTLSSFTDWPGGWTVGPRYLTPILPFFSIPFAIFLSQYRGNTFIIVLTYSFIIYSIFINFLCTVQFPYYPDNVKNPFFELVIPFLKEGIIIPNSGMFIGLHPILSILIPLFLILSIVIYFFARMVPLKFHVISFLLFIMLLYGASKISRSEADQILTARIEILNRLGKKQEALQVLDEAINNFPSSQYIEYWNYLKNQN